MSLFIESFNIENFDYNNPDEVISVITNLVEDIICLKEDIKHMKATVHLSEHKYEKFREEFNIHCAESGRDREACFTDPESELYEFITEALETDNWEVVE